MEPRITSAALAVVQRSASGQSLRLIGTNWDITDLKRAQAELLNKERQFRFIFEAAPVGLCWHQRLPDGSVTLLVNDAHLKICGITRDQVEKDAGISSGCLIPMIRSSSVSSRPR
jgi:PAS domain-containing protein